MKDFKGYNSDYDSDYEYDYAPTRPDSRLNRLEEAGNIDNVLRDKYEETRAIRKQSPFRGLRRNNQMYLDNIPYNLEAQNRGKAMDSKSQESEQRYNQMAKDYRALKPTGQHMFNMHANYLENAPGFYGVNLSHQDLPGTTTTSRVLGNYDHKEDKINLFTAPRGRSNPIDVYNHEAVHKENKDKNYVQDTLENFFENKKDWTNKDVHAVLRNTQNIIDPRTNLSQFYPAEGINFPFNKSFGGKSETTADEFAAFLTNTIGGEFDILPSEFDKHANALAKAIITNSKNRYKNLDPDYFRLYPEIGQAFDKNTDLIDRVESRRQAEESERRRNRQATNYENLLQEMKRTFARQEQERKEQENNKIIKEFSMNDYTGNDDEYYRIKSSR